MGALRNSKKRAAATMRARDSRERARTAQRIVKDLKTILEYAKCGDIETILVAAKFWDGRGATTVEGSTSGTWAVAGLAVEELLHQFAPRVPEPARRKKS